MSATTSPVPTTSSEVAQLTAVTITYGSDAATPPALREVTLALGTGEVVALMGRNGAGKSTLLSSLVGLGPVPRGRVRVGGRDPRTLAARDLLARVGLVPQEPGDLLECATVAEECRAADRDAGVEAGTTRALLALMAPEIVDTTHPRDLSEGQRLLLALVIVLAARPPLLLLDEPTRGLDYPTKARLARILADLAEAGHALVLATHDVELVAVGPTSQVVTSSPMFAPQVAKILSPQAWLTVDQVAAALASPTGTEGTATAEVAG